MIKEENSFDVPSEFYRVFRTLLAKEAQLPEKLQKYTFPL